MKRDSKYVRGRQRNKRSIKIRFLSSENKKLKCHRGNSAKYNNSDMEICCAEKIYGSHCSKFPSKISKRCCDIKYKKIIENDCRKMILN